MLDMALQMDPAARNQSPVLAVESPGAAAGSRSAGGRIAVAAAVGIRFVGIASGPLVPSVVGFAQSSRRSRSSPRVQVWLAQAVWEG